MDCESILKDRKNPNSKSDKLSPHLIIIDDIDWIYDDDIINYINLEKEDNKTEIVGGDIEIPADLMAELFGSHSEEMEHIQDDKLPKTTTYKVSQRDLINAVENLVKNGTKYNIFTIICSSDYNKLNKISGTSVFESKEVIVEDYSVFATKTLLGGASSTCYMSQNGSTVRLFDYTDAKEMWKKLKGNK